MVKLVNNIWRQKDLSSLAMLILIGGVAIWILALPLSRTVQDCYLRRFHLATPSFPLWAMQQAVPSMYNLENRYWCCTEPVDAEHLWDQKSGASVAKSNMANHFPTRVITFGDARRFIRMNGESNFYIESKYRGRKLRSIYTLDSIGENKFELVREESTIE